MNKLYYVGDLLCGESTIEYNQGSLNEQNIRLYIKKEVNIDFLNLYIWWEGGGDDGGLLAENDEECDVGDDEVGAGDGVGLMVGGVHSLKSFLWLGLC